MASEHCPTPFRAMPDIKKHFFCLFVLAALFWPGAAYAEPSVVRVAAASDLRFVLPDIADAFSNKTGIEVRLTFGASGNFTRQILAGAPFDLFLSADEGYAEQLVTAGKTSGPTQRYATGRIVLFVPTGSLLSPVVSWDISLADAIGRGQVARFAIANPEHAPYGRAAAEALRKRGLWSVLQPHLIWGESAAQAARFAASGSSQGGIIPLSIALSPPFRDKGRYLDIPAGDHAPLHQSMILLKGAAPAAQLFYDHLQSPGAQDALGHFGFTRAGE